MSLISTYSRERDVRKYIRERDVIPTTKVDIQLQLDDFGGYLRHLAKKEGKVSAYIQVDHTKKTVRALLQTSSDDRDYNNAVSASILKHMLGIPEMQERFAGYSVVCESRIRRHQKLYHYLKDGVMPAPTPNKTSAMAIETQRS
jgi:predicted transcriptional regulator